MGSPYTPYRETDVRVLGLYLWWAFCVHRIYKSYKANLMENNNQSSVKTKNITFGLVFGWIFGILIGIPALFMLTSKPISGILFLLAAIIAFPPTYKFLKEKLHIGLSRGLKIALVLILLIMAGVSSSKSDVPSVAAEKTTTPVVAQPVIQVTAVKLAEDYKANEVAADAKYKNKVVEVTGLVNTIGKDILDTPYIALSDGGQYSFTSVQCMFSEKDESLLSTVSKGDRVTLKGTVSGKLGNVNVSGCSIVK